jgi:hypothetical protein
LGRRFVGCELKPSYWSTACDNLAKAERLGLIGSGEQWVEARQLRNFMVHEYVRDPAVLAAALQRGHETVPLLLEAARAMADMVNERADHAGRG